MTAKDKAKELVDKFKPHADWNNDYGSSEPQANLKHAKQCALICVDEILKYQPYDVYSIEQCNNVKKYWDEVKQEINQL